MDIIEFSKPMLMSDSPCLEAFRRELQLSIDAVNIMHTFYDHGVSKNLGKITQRL